MKTILLPVVVFLHLALGLGHSASAAPPAYKIYSNTSFTVQELDAEIVDLGDNYFGARYTLPSASGPVVYTHKLVVPTSTKTHGNLTLLGANIGNTVRVRVTQLYSARKVGSTADHVLLLHDVVMPPSP